ncbi:MAG: DNA-deoxyinosine glycosylase [Eubacteriales bacterium]|nr:DNA-deoxyinosine glycosylase [Eubacteriales bacterium]
MDREFHTHGFGPVIDKDSEILILGSFPSVKSREEGFFYGHPRNRFWLVLAELFQQSLPVSVSDKRDFLLRNHVAVYDVIESCSVVGSSDSSISDVEPADIAGMIRGTNIKGKIYTNGAKAWQLYHKYIEPETGIPAVKLPSTSPANAAFSLERLVDEWRLAIDLPVPERV